MMNSSSNGWIKDHQPYDVAHGNKPQFISGNHYNHHERKRQRANNPKPSAIKVFSLEKMEHAKATKDERRARRQATRKAASDARMVEQQHIMKEMVTYTIGKRKPQKVDMRYIATLERIVTV